MSDKPIIAIAAGDPAGGVGDHPFTAFDSHGVVGVVVDGDEIDEAEGAVGRSGGLRLIHHAINGDKKFGGLVEFSGVHRISSPLFYPTGAGASRDLLRGRGDVHAKGSVNRRG